MADLPVNDDVMAMSHAYELVEWNQRFQGYQPQFTGKGDEQSNWLPLVDGYCSIVRDRWAYVIVSLAATRDTMVAFEIYVDDDQNAFFAHRSETVTPLSPIPQRGEKINQAGASGPTVRFPAVDTHGQALSVRLLYSRFRLPSATLKKLVRKRHRDALIGSIPPLWEWKKGYDKRSTVHSKDGYSLIETPLWMGKAGEERRVWAGTDPFTVVESCSNAYVQARNRYVDKFEPKNDGRKREVLRLNLGRALTGSVLKNPSAHAKYAGALRVTDMNAALERDDGLRRRLIRSFEDRGAALCKVLDSELFSLYQEASLDEEGIDKENMSAPLVEHLRVLSIGVRMLGDCKSGQALHASWAEEAEKKGDHFLNRVVFPTKDPVMSHFKAFRWSSKAVASLLAETISHRIRARRVPIKDKLAHEIRAFLRLGVGNAFDPQHGIVDFALADDLVTHGELDMKKFSVKVSSAKPGAKPQTITYAAVDPTMDALFEEWVDAGKLNTTGRNKKLLDAKFVGGMLLDVINLVAAVAAIEEAEGGDEAVSAMLGAGVAGISLLVNVGEQAFKWGLEKKFNSTRATQVFVGLKLVVGAYYGWKNLAQAERAFRNGDSDRGFALDVAAAAEFAAVGGQVWVLVAPGSLVAPWVIPIAGAVAAGAYIAANYLTDDPLDQFLRNCAWGIAPYKDDKEHWAWSEKSVLEWRNDYVTQADTLLRLLVRLRVVWSFNTWPGLTVMWELSQPSTTLQIEYRVRLRNGKEFRADTFTFEGRSIPKKAPHAVDVKLDPSATYTGPGIDRVTAHVTLTIDRNTKPEVLECLLMQDGNGIRSDKVSRVPEP